jgi:isoleucyl-tRNA synthetase
VPDGAFTLPDVPDVGVLVTPAEGDKCERCWRVLPEVGPHGALDGVCDRCADAVAAPAGAVAAG